MTPFSEQMINKKSEKDKILGLKTAVLKRRNIYELERNVKKLGNYQFV
jgi:hypothetical protein